MNAKKLFALSVLLNLALLAVVAHLAARKPGTPVRADRPLSAEPSTALAAQSAKNTSPEAAPKSFHWGQLESSDYKTYISNLRAIGCPERTIRDIITADVDSLYSRKIQRSQSREGQKLRQEENAVIVSLLGPAPEVERGIAQADGESGNSQSPYVGIQSAAVQGSTVQMTTSQGWISRSSAADGHVTQSAAIQEATAPNSGASWNTTQPGSVAWGASSVSPANQTFAQGESLQNASAQGSGGQDSPNPQREVRVSVPVAFQSVDPNALRVSDEQQQILDQIRQNFVTSLGGDNQDPGTPQYLNRWQNAQRQSDGEMRAMLGGQAFLQYQLQAAVQGANPAPGK